MRVVVPLAQGVEEMEAVILIDVLRRAEWDVTSVAVASTQQIKASRGVTLVADMLWTELETINDFDGIVIPGGLKGCEHLRNDNVLLESLRDFHAERKLLAAICAGPTVLHAAGIMNNICYTCYPGLEKQLEDGTYVDQNVVTDKNIITSQGPGTAFPFALTLIEKANGSSLAQALRDQMIL